MTRNVALFVLDSVRKDVFDERAPRLRSLADSEAAQCRSTASWTVPSHASMLTGESPHEHGVHTHNRDYRTLDVDDTLFGDLPAHRAVGASANAYLSTSFGFDGFFDAFHARSGDRLFDDGRDVSTVLADVDASGRATYPAFLRRALGEPPRLKTLANGLYGLSRSRLARSRFPVPGDDGARAIADAVRDDLDVEPYLLFANLMEAHPPFEVIRAFDRSEFDVPTSWTSRDVDLWAVNRDGALDANERDIANFRTLYRASVGYLDDVLAPLVEDVVDAGDRETTVIVTADHGENLAYPDEHGLIGHVGSMSEALLHVPLLIVNPPEWLDDLPDDRYLSQLALRELVAAIGRDDPVDVADITAETASAEILGGVSPAANVPLTEEERRYWDRAMRAHYDGQEKYVWDSFGRVQPYALDSDAPCRQDVRPGGAVPETALAAFDGELAEVKRRAVHDGEVPDVDDGVEERLRELGYR